MVKETMVPALVDDPERLQRLKRARRTAEYAQHHIDDLRELDAPFVVLDGTEVVGHGDTPEEAWDDAGEGAESDEDSLLIRVPREDETFLF